SLVQSPEYCVRFGLTVQEKTSNGSGTQQLFSVAFLCASVLSVVEVLCWEVALISMPQPISPPRSISRFARNPRTSLGPYPSQHRPSELRHAPSVPVYPS